MASSNIAYNVMKIVVPNYMIISPWSKGIFSHDQGSELIFLNNVTYATEVNYHISGVAPMEPISFYEAPNRTCATRTHTYGVRCIKEFIIHNLTIITACIYRSRGAGIGNEESFNRDISVTETETVYRRFTSARSP